MENHTRHTLDLLRNRMTSDDLRQLSDTEVSQLKAIYHHWQMLMKTEHRGRVKTNTPVFAMEGGCHGI